MEEELRIARLAAANRRRRLRRQNATINGVVSGSVTKAKGQRITVNASDADVTGFTFDGEGFMGVANDADPASSFPAVAVFTFNVAFPGFYILNAMVIAPSSTDDSFFVETSDPAMLGERVTWPVWNSPTAHVVPVTAPYFSERRCGEVSGCGASGNRLVVKITEPVFTVTISHRESGTWLKSLTLVGL